jgi:hypothetical protein
MTVFTSAETACCAGVSPESTVVLMDFIVSMPLYDFGLNGGNELIPRHLLRRGFNGSGPLYPFHHRLATRILLGLKARFGWLSGVPSGRMAPSR